MSDLFGFNDKWREFYFSSKESFKEIKFVSLGVFDRSEFGLIYYSLVYISVLIYFIFLSIRLKC